MCPRSSVLENQGDTATAALPFVRGSTLKRVFATPQDAEAAFYEALEACDLEAMMDVWSEDDDLICVHPGAPRLVGYDAVRESWQRIFQAGQRLKVRLTTQIQMTSGMIAIHSVHENLTVPDERNRALAVATNVYIRAAHGWRMIVHHSSPTPAVPEQPSAGPKILH
jgi:ketosteroid isomerase-like protein